MLRSKVWTMYQGINILSTAEATSLSAGEGTDTGEDAAVKLEGAVTGA